jgi:hypothetical protein
MTAASLPAGMKQGLGVNACSNPVISRLPSVSRMAYRLDQSHNIHVSSMRLSC